MTPDATQPALSFTCLEAIRDIRYQMMAAFSIMVWDFILTFEGEMKFVWRMRNCMLKWFFFYFRYLLLAAQLVHLALSPILSSGRLSNFLCAVWYRYVVLILQLSASMIEIIWATRVFALFNRSRQIGIFLGSLILVELGPAGVHLAKCPMVGHYETCMLARPLNHATEVYIGIVMFVQSTIVGMVIFKYLVDVRLGRMPLLSFLVRDATFHCFAIFLLCGIALAICGLDDQRVFAIFYWSITLYSVIGCRLILNMEPFARQDTLDEEILLTSHITL